MPRLNSLDGRAVQGNGSISVAGIAVPGLVGVSANQGCWFNEAGSVLVYQDYTLDPPNYLKTIDLDTSATATVATHGASLIGAGGGVWASFLGAGPYQGVRTSVGGFGPFSQAGPVDVDESGRSAFVQNYAAGQGMQCYSAAGALVATWDVQLTPGFTIRCRTNLVAYPATGFVWSIRNLTTGAIVPMAPRAESINALVPFVFGTRTMVLERSERLTLRDATGGVGYVLTEDDTFTPDICALSATVIRIAYSAGAGEGATELRLIDLNLGSGATTNWTSASGTLVSSAGPTLTAATFPVGPVQGGDGSRELQFIMRTPIVQPDRMLTREWWDFFNKLSLLNSQPIDLSSQVTGVLGEANGGTGTGSGTTVLNGANIVGIIPTAALVNVPNVGYWTPVTSGATLNLESVIAQAGSWSPLMSGPDAATSTMVLDINGDAIAVWTASGNQTYLPPFVDDGSGAPIAVFMPVTDEAVT